MNGILTRTLLYATALTTGATFSVLFTGQAISGQYLISAPGKGLFVMLGATFVALLVGSAGAYRFVMLLPSIALYALLVLYGLPPLTPKGWQDLLFRIGHDFWAGASTMYAQPVPYDYQPGVLLLLIPAVMVVVAFATSATLYEKSPVVSVAVLGMTIGVISTVSFETGIGPFFAVFLSFAVALLLSAGSEGSRTTIGGAGIVAGVAVVALVLLLPKTLIADQTIRAGAIDWTRIGVGGTSRLQPQADVGSYLTSGRDAELLRIYSDEPLLWRAGTLDYFDGVRWSDTTGRGKSYGEEIGPGVQTQAVRQSVEVLDAETTQVFGGYDIRSVSLPSAEPETDGSWSLPYKLSRGDHYEVLSEVPQPTEEQLQRAGTAYPAGIVEKYLQLPGNTPQEVVDTAHRIERDYNPQTPYETSRAVERYLLYDGGFTYNLNVDFRRANDAIAQFLGDKREGFCTHFATSMVLILREEGIPARMVYGATTGQEVGKNEYLVTGANMHTWVEVYFPGVGWYPFNPTPGFSIPETMQQNAPRTGADASGFQDSLIPGASSQRQPQSVNEQPEHRFPLSGKQRANKQKPEQTPERVSAWPLYVLIPALLIVAIPLTKRALRAWGRPGDLYRDLVGKLSDVLPPGRTVLARSPALTPTERILLLAAAAGVEEETLREFARAYSEHLYSANNGPGTGGAVSETYREALASFERLPLWRRMLGAVNPVSLIARAESSVSSAKERLVKRLARRPR